MSRILITGARAPIALDLAHSFQAAGHEVHLADSVRPWAARLSWEASRIHRLAPPRFDFPRFRGDVRRLIDALDPRLIVPTCEEVFYLAAAAAADGYGARLFAPNLETLRDLHSKVEFSALAKRAGAAAIDTRRIADLAELEALGPRAQGLVFKPEYSRFAGDVLIRPGPEALAALGLTGDIPWAAQAYVPGDEVCIWSAAREGRIVAFAAYRPLWRLGRSSSFYFQSDDDPALLALAQQIARYIGSSGQLSFDVIRTAEGRLVPIECNPRGVSGIHLFDGDPRLAAALLGDIPFAEPAAPARHLGLAMTLIGAPMAAASGRWGAFRRDLKTSREVAAFHGKPLAQAGALIDAARFAAVGALRGRSAAGQSTSDIEWNGEPIA